MKGRMKPFSPGFDATLVVFLSREFRCKSGQTRAKSATSVPTNHGHATPSWHDTCTRLSSQSRTCRSWGVEL